MEMRDKKNILENKLIIEITREGNKNKENGNTKQKTNPLNSGQERHPPDCLRYPVRSRITENSSYGPIFENKVKLRVK